MLLEQKDHAGLLQRMNDRSSTPTNIDRSNQMRGEASETGNGRADSGGP